MLEEKTALDETYRRRVTKTKGGGGFGKSLPTGDGNVSGFVILRTTKIKNSETWARASNTRSESAKHQTRTMHGEHRTKWLSGLITARR
ncbi:hypothetical protein [Phaeobacter sp. LSS9]|uniref:hypothetical protein n=1 Tax=unclassified Phaeobacter TaxID=2621772 RepID=UPI0013C34E28|nr:hypothetical protein [Phaeobacter sp. LSS9]